MASDRDTLTNLIAENMDCPSCNGISADALIRAGWRPPARVVTDPAEMDTWPLGTVVRGYGVAHQNVPGFVQGDVPLWLKPTGRPQTSAELLADCPGGSVTVLFIPPEDVEDDGDLFNYATGMVDMGEDRRE